MNRQHLVITSIAAASNPVLQTFANECRQRDFNFIIIGDKKSPDEFHLEACSYYSIERQQQLGFSLTENLPYGHYARKNLGYLLAMSEAAAVIVETDDDNSPKASFWNPRYRCQSSHLLENTGWTNVYAYFTDTKVWPRGFALEEITAPVAELGQQQQTFCPIQQGLADENPDVDAIYRLTGELPVFFSRSLNMALGKNSICPFNSQNTSWFPEAYPLMYLPSYCSFRMTDIWRSFIAQRIVWACDWAVLFHKSSVIQSRNEHDLMADFHDEIPGYSHNYSIMQALSELELKQGSEHIAENMLACYQSLIDLGVLPQKEMLLLKAWLADVSSLEPFI